MGYTFKESSRIGIVKAIKVLENKTLVGVGDPRNPDDHAEGLD